MTTIAEFDARSLLFVPADAERFIPRAAERGADLIVLDLEDGVAPAAKARARAALPTSVARLQTAGAVVYVRVNNAPGLLDDDVGAAVASGAHGIVLPKVEQAEQLARFDADLLREEQRSGRTEGHVRVIVLIETPQGVCRAAEIARGSPRVVAMCFGPEDFATAMGIEPHVDGMTAPAQAVAIAAVAAGIEPLGVPGTVADFSDLDAYRALAVHARRIGMRGAVCIHPDQVRVNNEVFGGTEAELAAARRLLAAFDAAVAEGRGAIALDGRMIDEPIANRARRLLARHEARLARAGRTSVSGVAAS